MNQLAVINASSTPDAEVRAWMDAVELQVQKDFYPVWGIPANLHFVPHGRKAPKGAWWMAVLDDADAAGALGYHDITAEGLPLGKVFVRPTLESGGKPSVTLSHEVLEILGDPEANRYVQDKDNALRFWFYETCLAGETTVPLADGSRPAIGELASRGLLQARRTSRAASLCRVLFTDGSALRCTPDHRLLLACGHYVAAQHLVSGDVLPRFAPADAIDRIQVYAVPSGQNASGLSARDECQHTRSRQLRGVDLLPALTPVPLHPVFRGGIKHVVVMARGKQVVGSNARPGVAVMADFESVRNWAYVPFIRKPMDRPQSAAVPNLPVASRGASAEPDPALRGLLDSGPESFGQRRRLSVVGAIREAQVKPSVFMLPRPMGRAQTLRSEWSDTARYGARHVKVIDRVESDGQGDVYDLTIPERHNFAVGAGVFVHNCDAPEADEHGYDVALPNGTKVTVSDFCLPRYFQPSLSGGAFDFKGHLTSPLPALLPGGYMGYVENGVFGQVMMPRMGRDVAAERWRARPHDGSRRRRRMTPKRDWIRSTVETA